MFTGLIQAQAELVQVENGKFLVRNAFATTPKEDALRVGESVCHDGACMSLTAVNPDGTYAFFAMGESLSRTIFGTKKVGEYFNVERSMRLDSRLDGHLVSGHIDTVAEVTNLEWADDGSLGVTIAYDAKYDAWVVEKGSITINGVSLTVAAIPTAGELTVWLIPITQADTNLGTLKVGDRVNIEFDTLAKYAEKHMRAYRK